MAEELRWETLQSTATTDQSAFGEFRNDTSADLFIRSIDMFMMVQDTATSAAVAQVQMQLSKSNTIDLSNNTSIFQLNSGGSFLHLTTAGSGPNGSQSTITKLYAKGQLILEPGESLFGHLDFGGTPTNAQFSITIGYHF